MDVRLPDGTIIQNVPDDISKADLTAKLKANGYDVSKLEPPPQNWWTAARPYIEPAVTTAGALAGGVVGAPLGPLGGVAGAGLGYAGGAGVMQAADVAFGPPQQAMTGNEAVLNALANVREGATLEMGGGVLGKLAGAGVRTAGRFLGGVADFNPVSRAAKIMQQAAGSDIGRLRAAMQAAPPDVLAGQATADIVRPEWQALMDRALRRAPTYAEGLVQAQRDVDLNALARLAGGSTATEARAAREAAVKATKQELLPRRDIELSAANIAGQELPRLEGQAQRLGDAVAAKVEDVRRFTAAGERAVDKGRQQMIEKGLPVAGARYSYFGELADAAERVATQAAEGSLRFGEGAAFAQRAAESLAAHGLRPLESAPVISAIQRAARDPKLAGNDAVLSALQRAGTDIAEWTNQGGVIDAFALDAIRKNAATAAIQKNLAGADPSTQQKAVAATLVKLKPIIDDAIERAGGTGYRQYLSDYASAMNEVNKAKLSAKALQMYEKSPDKFVELVKGNTPREVEKILGPGQYDIAKELSESALTTLRAAAGTITREQTMKAQAQAGQELLREIMQTSMFRGRLPPFLSAKITLANRGIDELEEKLGKKTLDVLTEAAKSGSNAEKIISRMKATERNKVLQYLTDPNNWVSEPTGRAAAYGFNALSSQENQNALRPQ